MRTYFAPRSRLASALTLESHNSKNYRSSDEFVLGRLGCGVATSRRRRKESCQTSGRVNDQPGFPVSRRSARPRMSLKADAPVIWDLCLFGGTQSQTHHGDRHRGSPHPLPLFSGKEHSVSACFTGGEVTRHGGSPRLRQTGAPQPARGVVSIFETVRRLGLACMPRIRVHPGNRSF